jgi:hypothetical protein
VDHPVGKPPEEPSFSELEDPDGKGFVYQVVRIERRLPGMDESLTEGFEAF